MGVSGRRLRRAGRIAFGLRVVRLVMRPQAEGDAGCISGVRTLISLRTVGSGLLRHPDRVGGEPPWITTQRPPAPARPATRAQTVHSVA